MFFFKSHSVPWIKPPQHHELLDLLISVRRRHHRYSSFSPRRIWILNHSVRFFFATLFHDLQLTRKAHLKLEYFHRQELPNSDWVWLFDSTEKVGLLSLHPSVCSSSWLCTASSSTSVSRCSTGWVTRSQHTLDRNTSVSFQLSCLTRQTWNSAGLYALFCLFK